MLLFSIEFTQSAEKQFGKLESGVQERIISAVERLRIRPGEHLVKLVGGNAYKFRVGDYRAVCIIDYTKECIYVVKVGHRKNVYD
ncbi:type II toxin-antitoxin system RelE/ParE family toxin [Candidatus Woesearchaeota archaeon]|nr:type II toxin-antitoxin system RelE/ParE family toxin [Candidatus Woesearchaeota archaeon]